MYLEVLKLKDENNWGNDVPGLRKNYNLPLKDENIKDMSVSDWKSFVKSSVYREAFLQLQVELSVNWKTSHLSYIKLCTNDYLKQIATQFCQSCLQGKNKNVRHQNNYKNKYCENLNCPFCCVLDESFDHLEEVFP